MFVHPITTTNFKAGKIELEKIHKQELTNYDSIKLLARQRFCDFLIKKKTDIKGAPEYSVIMVFARRKWIQPQYVFGSDLSTVPKNASPNEIAKVVFETSSRAAKMATEKTIELAKTFIHK